MEVHEFPAHAGVDDAGNNGEMGRTQPFRPHIARHITGTRCSGPAVFGLTRVFVPDPVDYSTGNLGLELRVVTGCNDLQRVRGPL